MCHRNSAGGGPLQLACLDRRMGWVKKHLEDLHTRGFDLAGDPAVCLDCIIDEGLREQTANHLTEPACTFCGRKAEDGALIAASFEEFMRIVMSAIRFRYERSIESLFMCDDVTPRYNSHEVAYDVCAGAISDAVLEAIMDVIDDDEWNEDPGMLRPDMALRSAWDDFRKKVKHETRFVFLSIPEEHSDHPDEFTTSEILEKLVEILDSRALIDIPAGRTFWRGRMIDEPEPRNYDASTLGSPPLRKASANRMSPAGISMFYGCDDVPTVVAEIGVHSAKRFAVIGAFETTRPLKMVNLASLSPVPSLFDPDKRKSYYELIFLHKFAWDLSQPVFLDGREHIDYAPTQVVTEYLRWLPGFAIDGILFASAQNGGTSCVIFCGPEGCADVGKETDKTLLRLIKDSIQVVGVVSTPVAP